VLAEPSPATASSTEAALRKLSANPSAAGTPQAGVTPSIVVPGRATEAAAAQIREVISAVVLQLTTAIRMPQLWHTKSRPCQARVPA
jgi:hypothetical protein